MDCCSLKETKREKWLRVLQHISYGMSVFGICFVLLGVGGIIMSFKSRRADPTTIVVMTTIGIILMNSGVFMFEWIKNTIWNDYVERAQALQSYEQALDKDDPIINEELVRTLLAQSLQDE